MIDWIPESRQDELDCCDSLLVSTTNPKSRAFQIQDEKFGIYRLQYVDRSPAGKGRATFKHIERNQYMYYINSFDVSGWLIGPQPQTNVGGLFLRVRKTYPTLLRMHYRKRIMMIATVYDAPKPS